jgi:hypothetical protein
VGIVYFCLLKRGWCASPATTEREVFGPPFPIPTFSSAHKQSVKRLRSVCFPLAVNRKPSIMSGHNPADAEKHRKVLEHLYALRSFYGQDFDKLGIFGGKATDLVKFLENPEPYFNKSFVYVCGLYDSIDKIYKRHILSFPKIPRRTDKERILLNLLLMYGEGILGRDPYFEYGVKLHHVLAYLKRDKVIYTWPPTAVRSVQGACRRGIDELLHPSKSRLERSTRIVFLAG